MCADAWMTTTTVFAAAGRGYNDLSQVTTACCTNSHYCLLVYELLNSSRLRATVCTVLISYDIMYICVMLHALIVSQVHRGNTDIKLLMLLIFTTLIHYNSTLSSLG
jgi:hypothetical protein